MRAGLLAALLLALPAAVALAKPPFETGPYLGSVTAKGSPPVSFTAEKKRLKKLDLGSQPVTCSNGRKGTINVPASRATRSPKVKHGKFEFKIKPSGSDARYAGTRVTGKLKGKRASGTVRVVLEIPSATGADPVVCDTGKRKWKAKLDEVFVELP